MSDTHLPSPTEPTTSVDFAAAARLISAALRQHRLMVPSFRCPPSVVGVDRSLRRRRGEAVVAVRIRHRPFAAVLADMIEGTVVANELRSPHADRLRSSLWEACGYGVEVATTDEQGDKRDRRVA